MQQEQATNSKYDSEVERTRQRIRDLVRRFTKAEGENEPVDGDTADFPPIGPASGDSGAIVGKGDSAG